jgi:PIN domain nuclease of toxin-antitoxin system
VTRLLLDTHVFVWWMSASRRLPDVVASAVEEASTVHVSLVSLWEIILKETTNHPMIGTEDPAGWFITAMNTAGFELLGIEFRHVAAVQRLPSLHTDPFDRMLIAQGTTEGFTVVSADRTVRRYPLSTAWT